MLKGFPHQDHELPREHLDIDIQAEKMYAA